MALISWTWDTSLSLEPRTRSTPLKPQRLEGVEAVSPRDGLTKRKKKMMIGSLYIYSLPKTVKCNSYLLFSQRNYPMSDHNIQSIGGVQRQSHIEEHWYL